MTPEEGDNPVPADPSEFPGASGESIEALFEQAVHTHSRRLLAIARAIVGNRASAEDVVQQAIVNLYQHRHRYDWREPGGLMRRSVVNEALRLLRQPRMGSVGDETGDALGGLAGARRGGDDQGHGPAGGMIAEETVRRVREAIAALPDHFRAALVLCEYESMSYVQIAEVLGCSVPQVKTWLHRGRRQLAERLKDLDDSREGRNGSESRDME